MLAVLFDGSEVPLVDTDPEASACVAPTLLGHRDPGQAKVLHEPVLADAPVAWLQRLASAGVGSAVFAPLQAQGEVLGVLNMVLIKGTRESALSQPSGISYAIPSRYVKELLDKHR